MMKRLSAGWILAVVIVSADPATANSGLDRDQPWREAGLTVRQAAGHLLDRFAYGPRPGQVDEVVEMGLGNWLEGQLAGDLPGSVLEAKVAGLSAVSMSQRQLIRRFSSERGNLVNEALKAGVITMEDYSGERGIRNLHKAVAALNRFGAERGMQPQRKVVGQLKAQKLLRAVYSKSQLVEVLTDFWFNHFNVSVHAAAPALVFSYERDAIRPNVLTSFRRLLGATARHPAMLNYLGNALSLAGKNVTTTFDHEIRDLGRLSPGDNPSLRQQLAKQLGWFGRHRREGPLSGLNENYARELLELHTLGVDGGYRQRDVIEVARAFTGWGTFPVGGAREKVEQALVIAETAETARDMGFVVEGEFVFRADEHDAEAKTVLGVPLPAGRGIEDGEDVLDLLARHPATRRRLARKLAVRFVSEHPSPALLRSLEETWELTEGNLAEMVRNLVRSPEFWVSAARRSKMKTPFELAASALRALDAEIVESKPLLAMIVRMGHPLYAYSAPTGFPDRVDYWANVGPLLGRLNFGIMLANSRIQGIRVDLPRFLGRHRMESLEEAVEFFFPHLMPERDATLTLTLISEQAGIDESSSERSPETEAHAADESTPEPRIEDAHAAALSRRYAVLAVGMLVGSPEYQVR